MNRLKRTEREQAKTREILCSIMNVLDTNTKPIKKLPSNNT